MKRPVSSVALTRLLLLALSVSGFANQQTSGLESRSRELCAALGANEVNYIKEAGLAAVYAGNYVAELWDEIESAEHLASALRVLGQTILEV